MEGYSLKKGEVYNGGYTVEIGNFSLRNIGNYEPVWEKVYDDENGFTDWTGNAKKFLLGRRFSLKITTGPLSFEDYNDLVSELNKSSFPVSCPDFEGECYCENVPANLTQANNLGKRYKVNITLIAQNIVPSGGGL